MINKGDFVKIGLSSDNVCTPFVSPKCTKIVSATVKSIYKNCQKRGNRPAFTCQVGDVLKTIGMHRTDFYQILTEDEYVLLRFEL